MCRGTAYRSRKAIAKAQWGKRNPAPRDAIFSPTPAALPLYV